MTREIPGTEQKALQINLDPNKYGTFAEIGAGQEVARWFFHVGGASGTIAKTISAYDMIVSDAIYGPSERYVSRQRLQSMLDHEYALLLERLTAKRGDTTKFFAFANTVAARSYSRHDEPNGWMGVRFQTAPKAEPSEIIIHVRMLDKENVQEQEALGIIGVNLIYAACCYHSDPETVIASLMDNLSRDRIEVDMIKFAGATFKDLDNRLMALQLVTQGLTDSAMFTANGEVVQAAEVLYKKPILVERGSFRPVTKVTIDMLNCAQAQFVQEPQAQGEEIIVLMEMTLRNLTGDGGVIDHKDFLDRVDLLGSLGKTVLISNYARYFRLSSYLSRYTKKMIGIAMGVPSLREIFEEKYYTDLEGGILEAVGRLFKNDLRLYVYPAQDPATGSIITAGNLRVAPHLRHLYSYLLENHFIQSIQDYNEAFLPIFSREVLEKIRAGDSAWEIMVPPQVAHILKQRTLFGYRSG
ncbi:MAG: nicotinate-nucleotide adenylyltransferase [Verrucomicrobia bacterium]|nr:MAG: nicotinate-nucleotide adenylyltransferase [Verrucomicrobiota bacterium]